MLPQAPLCDCYAAPLRTKQLNSTTSGAPAACAPCISATIVLSSPHCVVLRCPARPCAPPAVEAYYVPSRTTSHFALSSDLESLAQALTRRHTLRLDPSSLSLSLPWQSPRCATTATTNITTHPQVPANSLLPSAQPAANQRPPPALERRPVRHSSTTPKTDTTLPLLLPIFSRPPPPPPPPLPTISLARERQHRQLSHIRDNAWATPPARQP